MKLSPTVYAAIGLATATGGKLYRHPGCKPGLGGVPHFKELGAQDAADPARKRMRSVPQNFKLAYLNGWWASKKASKTAPPPHTVGQ